MSFAAETSASFTAETSTDAMRAKAPANAARALCGLGGLLLAMLALVAWPTAAGARASRERKVQASLTIELGPPSTLLPATQTITLSVPSGVRDAGAKLPQCNPTRLQALGESACPKGSQIGSGAATGYTLGVVEPLKLRMYNGPGASLLTYVLGFDPVSIQQVVQGAVTRPGGNYGQQLSFTIPHSLLEPLPEDPAWLLTLNATLSGRVGWLRSTNCPPRGWSEAAKLGYTNGQSLALAATLACV